MLIAAGGDSGAGRERERERATGTMRDVLSPRESGEFIAKRACNIKILEPGIKELSKTIAEHLKDGSLSMSGFSQCEVHPKVADEKAINWIFLVDTLNFCFWTSGDKKAWSVKWNGKLHTGYFALCAAVNRAIDDGLPVTDPRFYSDISVDELRRIFRGDGDVDIPLAEERQKCLHEVGRVLNEKFRGSFVNCIATCDNSARRLLRLVVDNFPCFRDEAVYDSATVSFYKRAQILVADIWVCFRGRNLGAFDDIDALTMFADYRVPQVLVHFNAMTYGEELMRLLKNDVILKNGSREETEIRGCSIHVVELVKREIETLLPGVKGHVDVRDNDDAIICNSILIDHFLWDYRRRHAIELQGIPFHKTRSVYY